MSIEGLERKQRIENDLISKLFRSLASKSHYTDKELKILEIYKKNILSIFEVLDKFQQEHAGSKVFDSEVPIFKSPDEYIMGVFEKHSKSKKKECNSRDFGLSIESFNQLSSEVKLQIETDLQTSFKKFTSEEELKKHKKELYIQKRNTEIDDLTKQIDDLKKLSGKEIQEKVKIQDEINKLAKKRGKKNSKGSLSSEKKAYLDALYIRKNKKKSNITQLEKEIEACQKKLDSLEQSLSNIK